MRLYCVIRKPVVLVILVVLVIPVAPPKLDTSQTPSYVVTLNVLLMGYIKNYDTLASNDNRKVVLDLIETAYASIAPEEVFKKDFSLENKILKIQGKTFDLNSFERVFLVGFGKGS